MANETMGTGGPTVGGYDSKKTAVEQRLDEKKSAPWEGETTQRIEYQTAKVPSLVYLMAAGLSIAASVTLFGMRRPLSAIFVGLWPPTFLLLGNYNKMVKIAEALTRQQQPLGKSSSSVTARA